MDYVIVVGSQRSGTTLMGQIIGSHPSGVMIDETDRLYDWTNAHLGSATNKITSILFYRCCKLAMTKYSDPSSRFHENGLLRNHVQFLVLKAPNLTYAYDKVPQAFPNAKIVYMFRDIRDVVASMKKFNNVPILKNQLAHILASDDLARMFPRELSLLRQSNWVVRPHVKMALVAKIKMSLSKCFLDNGLDVVKVRYEELVSHPEHVIPHVLEELGIPPATECLRHYEVFQDLGPDGTQRSRPLDERSIGKWKTSLTKRQAKEIWQVVGDFMETIVCG